MIVLGGRLPGTENKRICQKSGLNSGRGTLRSFSGVRFDDLGCGASQWWRRCTWDVPPVNLKKRAKRLLFGAFFNIPSINMDRTLVIRCQFLLVLLLVRRYIRRKREEKRKRKFWVRPMLRERSQHGQYHNLFAA